MGTVKKRWCYEERSSESFHFRLNLYLALKRQTEIDMLGLDG